MGFFKPDSGGWRLATKTVTFTGGAGAGATGTVNVFTVTGTVLINFCQWACTVDLEDTVDGALFSVGTSNLTQTFYNGGAIDIDNINAGVYQDGASSIATGGGIVDASADARLNITQQSVIITVSTQAITSGALLFYCQWMPLSAGATLVAA